MYITPIAAVPAAAVAAVASARVLSEWRQQAGPVQDLTA